MAQSDLHAEDAIVVATQDHVDQALRLMARTHDDFRSRRPEGTRVTWPLDVVIGIDQQLGALFRSIHSLLTAGLISPANVLLRTLFWDSLALQYMAADRDHAEHRALRWLRSAICSEISLLRSGQRLTATPGARDLATEINTREEELRLIDAVAVEREWPRLRTFPSPSDIARVTGQAELVWIIDGLSRHAHTSRWALAFGVRSRDDETMEVGLQFEPIHAVQAATIATAVFTAGALSAAVVLGFATADELNAQRSSAEHAFAELAHAVGQPRVWGTSTIES